MVAVLIPLLVMASMSAVMVRQQNPRPLRMPWVTVAIFAVTAAVGSFAVFDDTLLDAIRRDPERLASGEWWRLFTPLVGQDGGLSGLLFNLVLMLALGAIVENIFGSRLLLVTYFAAGLVSEVAAYTVMPDKGFAGNSVAYFGWIGLLIGTALVTKMPARLFGLVGTVLGVVLLVLWDLHGVGFWVGALIGIVRGGIRWLAARPRPATTVSPATPPQ